MLPLGILWSCKEVTNILTTLAWQAIIYKQEANTTFSNDNATWAGNEMLANKQLSSENSEDSTNKHSFHLQ